MDKFEEKQKEYLMSEHGFRRQLESIADVYQRMTDICHTKCITSYKTGDLSAAEGLCVDRCVLKYLEVQGKVQERLMAANAQMLHQ